MTKPPRTPRVGRWLLLALLAVTVAVYWPGLAGGWLFDDYPNIVDNKGIQIDRITTSELARAALSSPASQFKRPLATLSFAANYLLDGMNPRGWKLVNLIIHLLNGLLVFLLARGLLQLIEVQAPPSQSPPASGGRGSGSTPPGGGRSLGDSDAGVGHANTLPAPSGGNGPTSRSNLPPPTGGSGPTTSSDLPPPTGGRIEVGGPHATGSWKPGARTEITAALIAGGWLLLPINLTGVLYVVQRMESLANVFVLLGLLGYVAGRRRMLEHGGHERSGLALSVASLILCTTIGVSAKETAVMLPLYAFLIEWAVFGFRARVVNPHPNPPPRVGEGGDAPHPGPPPQAGEGGKAINSSLPPPTGGRGQMRGHPHDWRIATLFALVLLLPLLFGLAWLLPHVLADDTWTSHDFTLGTRLLSEARIVVAYVAWTLLPLPHWLSFYHDNFQVSTGLLSPWTTLISMVVLVVMVATALGLRRRRPLVTLGITLFLGCHLLTATILPLELIYEHRNYFASFGLLLALIPLLTAPPSQSPPASGGRGSGSTPPGGGRSLGDSAAGGGHASTPPPPTGGRTEVGGPRATRLPWPLPRYALLAFLGLWWITLTLLTSITWGNRLALAEELAVRAPDSPRAQYELGRTYIVYSGYDAESAFTPKVYPALERAARLPDSSILPEQALIFFNARMQLPLKDAWWDRLTAKLAARPPGVQDESSLAALVKCARDGACELPEERMQAAFQAALSHPLPRARLWAHYGDYAWNVLHDHALGLDATREAVAKMPNEPAYRITLARMHLALRQPGPAREQVRELERLNYGGRLDGSIADLKQRLQNQ